MDENSSEEKRTSVPFETQNEVNITIPIMKRSRLRSSLEKKTKQQIAFMIFGMIAIVALLGFFAVPILVNYGAFLEKMKGSEPVQSEEQTNSFVAPPILTEDFTATNSAKISIEGTTTALYNIKLYVNDELKDKVTAKQDGSFIVRNVALSDGGNTIRAKAIDENKKESGFSNTLSITYKNKGPEVSIDYPADNQIITTEGNNVIIKGKTDPEAKVTVNGFWAIVDSGGNWQYTLNLQGGDNRYKVEATDNAGNKKELERNVIYNR